MFDNAANYTTKEVKQLIREFKEKNPNNEGLQKRSDKSYLNEWAVHALCSIWGIMKERAKNANLQFEMEPEVKFLYNVLGPIARLILKLYKKYYLVIMARYLYGKQSNSEQ